MCPIGGQDFLCVGIPGWATGDAIGNLTGAFSGFLIDAVTFDDESLSDVWKVQVVIELGGDPDFAGFDPAMIRGRMIDEIWLLSVPEVEFDICKEGGLVCFDGEMIVGVTLLDQVVGEFALG